MLMSAAYSVRKLASPVKPPVAIDARGFDVRFLYKCMSNVHDAVTIRISASHKLVTLPSPANVPLTMALMLLPDRSL